MLSHFNPVPVSNKIRLDDFILNMTAPQATLQKRKVNIPPKNMPFLVILLEAAGEIGE